MIERIETGERSSKIVKHNGVAYLTGQVAEGETIQVTLSVEAFQEGSPMDPILYLYDDRIFTDFDAPHRAVRNSQPGDIANLDPLLRYTIDEAGDWAILIKNNGSGGSDFHWYVLDVDLTPVTE